MSRFVHILQLVAIFFLGFQTVSFAQFRSGSRPEINLTPSISFSVCDSLSGDGLPSAVVSIVNGKDTVNVITDSGGCGHILKKGLCENSVIITSFMGYRTRRDSLHFEPRVDTYVKIGMQEEPMVLNSIIVKGDAVAMVMHGDTTVFNAKAFNTLEGQSFRRLLEQMPGVVVEENGISYRGQQIDRILFNGNNLFGKDMKNAMDMVLANEVKSVKVYDKKAVDDMEDDDTVAKERVMDVHTWKPLEHVGELSLTASGGMFLSKNADGKFDWNADGDVRVGNYSIGAKPRITAEINGGHNSVSGQPTSYPHNELNGLFRIGKDVPGKSGYSHTVRVSSSGDRSSGSSIYSFFPSETWNERRDTSASENRKSGYSISYLGGGNIRRGKITARFKGALSYGQTRQNDLNSSSSWQDAKWSGFSKSTRDTTNRFKGSFSATLTKLFEKRGRKMLFDFSVSGSYDWGNGARIDTLKNSIGKEWLSNNLSSGQVAPSFAAIWNEPLGKKSTLAFSASAEYVYDTTKKLYTDIFSSTLNLNNSKDFTTNYISGTVSASYRYGRKNDGLYAFVTLGVQDILSLRTERLENLPNWKCNYLRPAVGAELSYSRGENSLSFNYREKESVPGVEQLRNVVNDSNPLFLYAGNPNLSLPVKRTFNIQFARSFSERNIGLEFKAGSSIYSKAIVSKTAYYQEETWLGDYGYTAPAGSSLTTPVNVSGRIDGWAGGKYSQYLNRIKANVGIELSWNIRRDPFYLEDALQVNLSNSLSASIPFNWQGKTALISIYPTIGVGRQENNGTKLYDSMNLSGYLAYTQRIWKCFELGAEADLSGMLTTRSDINVFTHRVRCSFSWIFGKEKRSRLSIFGSNLTSQVNNKEISVTDNYILTSMFNNFGRSVGLSFTYVFSRR